MSERVRYQVFVSSTYTDLRDEREHVMSELTKVGYIAVGMEQFPATDEEQLEFIRPLIDESDYYVVIIKGKYGSTTSDGISFTEKEFEYAKKSGKPVLAFLYKHEHSLQVADTDNDGAKLLRLKAFKETLTSQRLVRHWTDKANLASLVKDSLYDLARRKGGVGWIRGNLGADPEVYKELEAARRRIAELEHLAKNGHAIEFDAKLSQGADEVVIRYYRGPSKRGRFSTSWDSLFEIVLDSIYENDNESAYRNDLVTAIKYWKKIPDSDDIWFEDDPIRAARQQFEALGVINVVKPAPGVPLIWKLTDKGKKYAAHVTAITRRSGAVEI